MIKPENPFDFGYFDTYEQFKLHAQLNWAWKDFVIASGLGFNAVETRVYLHADTAVISGQ